STHVAPNRTDLHATDLGINTQNVGILSSTAWLGKVSSSSDDYDPSSPSAGSSAPVPVGSPSPLASPVLPTTAEVVPHHADTTAAQGNVNQPGLENAPYGVHAARQA